MGIQRKTGRRSLGHSLKLGQWTSALSGARRLSVPALVVSGLALLAPSVNAAKVKGQVGNFMELENPVWADAKEPKNRGYSFREPVPTVPSRFRKLFPHIPKELCVALLAKTAQKAPKPILIRVGGGRTTPVSIVVPPGTQFTFQNTDPFVHQLYGVGISTFNPASTVRGGTRDWSVPKAGSFEIRDKRAPSVRMWIIGEPNVAAIAYPNLKGEFLLDAKEAGEYEIQAYFAGKKVGPATPVSVGPRDLTIKDVIKVAPDPKKEKDDKDKDAK